VFEASHRMGKWFAPNSVRRSYGMEGTKRPLIRLLLLFQNHKRNHLPIQTHSEMSRFATAVRSVPHSGCLYQSFRENLTFSDETPILMKIADSKDVARLIRIRHLKQVVPYLNQTGHFYHGKVVPRQVDFCMLTDCWWTFRRDVPKAKRSSKSSTVIF